jgi:death on curing protein
MIEIALFLQIAERVLEVDADRLKNVTKIGSAESALAAPFASFGGHDFYNDPVQRAAILASRIMRNHPLPDGNKRVALILMTTTSKTRASVAPPQTGGSIAFSEQSLRVRSPRTISLCGSVRAQSEWLKTDAEHPWHLSGDG